MISHAHLPSTLPCLCPCSTLKDSTYRKCSIVLFIVSSMSAWFDNQMSVPLPRYPIPYQCHQCSSVNRKCHNRPIRGYTGIQYTGTERPFVKNVFRRSFALAPMCAKVVFIVWLLLWRSVNLLFRPVILLLLGGHPDVWYCLIRNLNSTKFEPITIVLTMLFSQLGAGHSIYSVSYHHCNY